MNSRAYRFVALLAVIGVSIVFGMVIGGRLNAPQVVLAAPTLQLAPASTSFGGADFADVVEDAMPAVVSVTSTQVEEGDDEDSSSRRFSDPFRFFFGEPEDDRGPGPRGEPRIGEGSGFIISKDGYLLTNNHVVEDSDRVVIGTQNGEEYEARVIGADPSIDLALLKIDPGDDELPVLPLGDSDALRVGQWVIAIGNPLEYEHTVTVGVVSAKQRRVAIGSTDSGVVTFIQTDAAINFGNSGGPLIDAAGNVIGINTAIRRANFAEGIGFALPINQARKVMEQLRERGYVRRGYIGITMNPTAIDDEAKEFYGLPDTNGVIVHEVQEDGPAERAGVRRGDIIRRVDGDVVRDNMDLISKIAAHQPDEKVTLDLFRDGKEITVKATLIDRQEELQARAGVRDSPPEPEQDIPDESSRMGVTVENLSSRWREALGLEEDAEGVLVTDVEFDSEAADKGIMRNMVIIAVNDESVRNVADWNTILDELPGGSLVKLDVMAGNRGSYVFLRVPRDD
jgi:serine protease Do